MINWPKLNSVPPSLVFNHFLLLTVIEFVVTVVFPLILDFERLFRTQILHEDDTQSDKTWLPTEEKFIDSFLLSLKDPLMIHEETTGKVVLLSSPPSSCFTPSCSFLPPFLFVASLDLRDNFVTMSLFFGSLMTSFSSRSLFIYSCMCLSLGWISCLLPDLLGDESVINHSIDCFFLSCFPTFQMYLFVSRDKKKEGRVNRQKDEVEKSVVWRHVNQRQEKDEGNNHENGSQQLMPQKEKNPLCFLSFIRRAISFFMHLLHSRYKRNNEERKRVMTQKGSSRVKSLASFEGNEDERLSLPLHSSLCFDVTRDRTSLQLPLLLRFSPRFFLDYFFQTLFLMHLIQDENIISPPTFHWSLDSPLHLQSAVFDTFKVVSHHFGIRIEIFVLRSACKPLSRLCNNISLSHHYSHQRIRHQDEHSWKITLNLGVSCQRLYTRLCYLRSSGLNSNEVDRKRG